MRTLLLVALCLTATACFAQGALAPSVAVGDDEVITVIALKYMDPGHAAEVLAALGFTGVIVPVNPAHRAGEFPGSTQSGGFNRRGGTRTSGGYYGRNRGGDQGQGYDGYQGAQQRGQQYPGYQSPYDYR
jgi:hypothetical protein